MGKFKDKLVQFMYGRYGIDQLYYAMMILSLVIMVANTFIRFLPLDIFVYVILLLMLLRTFSKNIYKRQQENQKFLKLWRPVKAYFSLMPVKIKEIKTNRYRKCPHCKAMLRLPRKTGKHAVNCPRCHKDFDVRVVI